MHPLRARLERAVDKSLPFVFVLLTTLLIADIFVDMHDFEPWVTIADYFVIAIFVLDLVFKWHHVPRAGMFVRLYWLDILAVFPFYLLFRVYIAIAGIAAAGEEAQRLLHEAVLLRETKVSEHIKMLREAEFAAKEASLFGRWIRFSQRSMRLLAVRWHEAHAHILRIHRKYKKRYRK